MTDNPFVTNGYAGPEYFCDRIEETRTLTELLTNGNNVALISPRRLGKTDLIHHCFHQPEVKDHYYTFIIDIYATDSLRDFVNVFGKAILEDLKPKGRKAWEMFLNAIKSVRSEISFDINNNPVWGVNIGAIESPDVTLDEIFEYLRQAIEAVLRTHIQRCPNANFVFSGSQRHLMGEIFISPSRPFYQSVTIMNLQKIPLEKYWNFANIQFAKGGQRKIQKETVEKVYQQFQGVTANVQKIMNLLYMRTQEGSTCTPDMVDKAVNSYLQLSSDTYEALLRQMPEKQRMVFLAIAAEGRAKNISGGKFVHKYHLPSPSSVISAIKGLLEKDFITHDGDEYFVYDQFFQLWTERL